MFRRIRIVSQTVFFVLFIFGFFFIAVFPRAYTWPADLFLRLNPLVALLASIASRTVVYTVFWTGLELALLTVIFGRVFCGFICPLGSTIDFSDRFLFGKIRSSSRRPPRFLQRMKYMLLFGLVILSLYGATAPLFMDPISLFTRIFAIVINPVISLTGLELLTLTAPIRWICSIS